MSKNNDKTFFSRSALTQDGEPLTYFPSIISMRKGEYSSLIILAKEKTSFLSKNPNGMSREELEFVLMEYKLFVKRYHKDIPETHFMLTTLPEKLRKDHDLMLAEIENKKDD